MDMFIFGWQIFEKLENMKKWNKLRLNGWYSLKYVHMVEFMQHNPDKQFFVWGAVFELIESKKNIVNILQGRRYEQLNPKLIFDCISSNLNDLIKVNLAQRN